MKTTDTNHSIARCGGEHAQVLIKSGKGKLAHVARGRKYCKI